MRAAREDSNGRGPPRYYRGIYADGWKAVTKHQPGTPFDADDWELYHLAEDRSECNDLADAMPEQLEALKELWWQEAEWHGVLPLDDRTIELFGGAPRPGTVHARPNYVYMPPLSHIPPGRRSPASVQRASARPCPQKPAARRYTTLRELLLSRAQNPCSHTGYCRHTSKMTKE